MSNGLLEFGSPEPRSRRTGHRRKKERLFGGKVFEDTGARDACAVRYIHGGGTESLLEKHRTGGLENLSRGDGCYAGHEAIVTDRLFICQVDNWVFKNESALEGGSAIGCSFSNS